MTGGTSNKKIMIDLDYIAQDTSFIYPLYSEEGKLLLKEREVLSAARIKSIREKYGPRLYYNVPENGENGISPGAYRKAFNDTKKIMDNVLVTGKFSPDAYKKSEEIISEILEDLNKNEKNALRLLREMHSFDEYLYRHAINVGLLTAFLTKKERIYGEKELKSVIIGAYLSDVGKIKMEKEILIKPGKLSREEEIQMKLHPQLGYNILKVLENADPVVLQTILFHHERYDDEGYYNLPYDTLPSSPKIVSICDMYDALTSPRPFRQAYTPAEAMKIITNTIDKKYDRQLVKDFINMAGKILNNSQNFFRRGDFCMLNTGEIAIITDFGRWDVLSPKVIVFARYENSPGKSSIKFFNTPLEIDLEKDLNRKLDGIIVHDNLILAIKTKLKEKKMLLEYLYSSIDE